jgi:hypothetical protein
VNCIFQIHIWRFSNKNQIKSHATVTYPYRNSKCVWSWCSLNCEGCIQIHLNSKERFVLGKCTSASSFIRNKAGAMWGICRWDNYPKQTIIKQKFQKQVTVQSSTMNPNPHSNASSYWHHKEWCGKKSIITTNILTQHLNPYMSKEPIFRLFKPPLECQRPIYRLCVKRHSSIIVEDCMVTCFWNFCLLIVCLG